MPCSTWWLMVLQQYRAGHSSFAVFDLDRFPKGVIGRLSVSRLCIET